MKKYILLPVLALLATTGIVNAQGFDKSPVINVENEGVKISIGARFMSDVAYYNTEYTSMNSGAAITDARIRTGMEFQNWTFYADFGFSGGEFAQKDIWLQYVSKTKKGGFHVIKGGYFNEPATLANNTSRGSLHFISRSAAVNALAGGRQLGATYKFYNDKFLANQGIFAENTNNNQEDGSQGVTLSGRWLYKPINTKYSTLHVGATFSYSSICTGTVTDDVLYTNLSLGTSMQTYTDPTKDFVNADVAWASDVYTASVEALYVEANYFVRGEYIYKNIGKTRDDYQLFVNQLGSSGSLASWQAANPLENSQFSGGYVEGAYLLFGENYSYSNATGTIGGMKGKSLELVARYSYLALNDVNDGELYVTALDKYYPNGYLEDSSASSTSIGGGNLHSATLGVNYSFNDYVQVLFDYTYNHLTRDKYVQDVNFHNVQARLIFAF